MCLVSGVVESIDLGSPSKCPVQGWTVTQEGKGQTHGSFSQRSWRYHDGVGGIPPWDLSVTTHSSESNSNLPFLRHLSASGLA